MEGFECLVVTALWVPPLIIHYTRIVNLLLLLPLLAVRLPEQLQKRAFPRELKKSPGRQMLAILKHLCHFPAPLTFYRSRRALPCHFFPLFASSPFSFFLFFYFPPFFFLSMNLKRSSIIIDIFDFEGCCWFGWSRWKIWIKIFKNFERYACYFTRKIFRACTNISIGLFNVISPCEDILNRFWTYWLNFQAKVQESQDCYLPKYNINSISFTLHLVSGLYILNDIKRSIHRIY